jgi:hypothetical protein
MFLLRRWRRGKLESITPPRLAVSSLSLQPRHGLFRLSGANGLGSLKCGALDMKIDFSVGE